MINQGLKMLKRAIDERQKGGMQTGIPKIQLREADALRAVAELEWAQQRIIELEQREAELAEENEHMKHIMQSHEAVCNDLGSVITERDELAATVEKLRDFADKVYHWNECTAEYRINYGSNGERDYYRDLAGGVLESTPPTNLNAVKQEAFADGYSEAMVDFKLVTPKNLQGVAAQRYPDKE